MGRELAAAIGRWSALEDHPVVPELVGVCDTSPEALRWFDRIASVTHKTTDRRHLLEDDTIDVLYLAVPHHLHEELYLDAVAAGKDFLGEKPFGIDLAAAERIVAAIDAAGVFVRCSSEMPFFPGAQLAHDDDRRRATLGQVIEVQHDFLHSSDLDRTKPINWKRQARYCGAIGVMGDLGMHVAHLPLRLGLAARARSTPSSATSSPSAPTRRPASRSPCDTIDNATLHCDAGFPLTLRTHRIAPGHMNTWRITRDRHGRRRELLDRAAEDRAPLRAARRPPGLGAHGGRKPVGLRHRHRADLRVRLRRRHPADVGLLPRRAGGRARTTASAAPPPPRRSPPTASSTRPCAPGRPAAPSPFSLPTWPRQRRA